MTIQKTAAALGAAVLLAGAPALASAATEVLAPAPVHVNSTQIEQYYGIFNNLYPGLVTVSFTNQAAQPVTDVVFDLEASNGQLLRQYDDVTSLQPGASAKQAFNDTEVGAGQTLAVDSVTFADGTTWDNTNAVAVRRQSADAGLAAPLFPYIPNSDS